MDTGLALTALNRVREAVKGTDGVGKLHLRAVDGDWTIVIPLDEMRHKKLRADIEPRVKEAARAVAYQFEPIRYTPSRGTT